VHGDSTVDAVAALEAGKVCLISIFPLNERAVTRCVTSVAVPEPHNADSIIQYLTLIHSVTSLRAALENRRIVTIRGLGHRVQMFTLLTRNHLQSLVHTRHAHEPKTISQVQLPAALRCVLLDVPVFILL
jgi:hypothetical protein